jgi:predicted RNA binding protein YcfA (HicA-like mRNA interferase family)
VAGVKNGGFGSLLKGVYGEAMAKSNTDVLRALKQDGWYRVGQTGRHLHFKHDTIKGKVTIPRPVKHLPIGTLKSIEKASGVKLAESCRPRKAKRMAGCFIQGSSRRSRQAPTA